MHRIFNLVGVLCCVTGAALIVANVALASLGFDATYNFGDPSQFEFILIPFWQLGLAIAFLGTVFVLWSRWLHRGSPSAAHSPAAPQKRHQ